ncbi:hypothetical protein AB0I92_04695 [Micromonospora chalcea]|uniref:hypothetical protein n=1 Tax=Micromonospora chalcea TaxID=1874 RepID=UPI0033E885D2
MGTRSAFGMAVRIRPLITNEEKWFVAGDITAQSYIRTAHERALADAWVAVTREHRREGWEFLQIFSLVLSGALITIAVVVALVGQDSVGVAVAAAATALLAFAAFSILPDVAPGRVPLSARRPDEIAIRRESSEPRAAAGVVPRFWHSSTAWVEHRTGLPLTQKGIDYAARADLAALMNGLVEELEYQLRADGGGRSE